MDAVTKEYTATLFKSEIENRFEVKIQDLLRIRIKEGLNLIINEVESSIEEQLEGFKRSSVSEMLKNLDIDEYEKIDIIKYYKDRLESKLPSCKVLLDEVCLKTCELVITEFRDNFIEELINDLSENGTFEQIVADIDIDEAPGNKDIQIVPYIKNFLEVGMSEEKIQNIFGKESLIDSLITDIVEKLPNTASNIVNGYVEEACEYALSDYLGHALGQMANQLKDMVEDNIPSGIDIEKDKREEGEEYSFENDDHRISNDQTSVSSIEDIVSTNKNIKLISTENYPYSYPFKFFNPVQSLVYPHKNKDNNMVIGANTSAGKTIAAELLIDSTLRKNKRIIYLSPLKSLTEEKYDDWQKRYRNETISIMTGDYVLSDETNEKIWKSKIIVMTSEMMDSRTRKIHSEKNYWMKEVGLVIVDEAHILSTDRGHAVETGIMRFTLLCPNARILFLSATMPNVESLGSWLTSLNNKETDIINSNWRPVELQKQFVEYSLWTSNRKSDYSENEYKKIKKTINLVMAKADEKFLVFVHSKKTGQIIKNKLKEKRVKVSFHSADLELNKRKNIEESFKDRENGIRVLVSTSTTAWGVNLPARNVIVVGVNRGLDEVDVLDLIQMAGRAGRYGIDDEGFVYIIIPEGSTEFWKNEFENPRPITSVLKKHNILAFHVLAEIQTNFIKNEKDLFNWYKRSLNFMQCTSHSLTTKPFSQDDAKNLFEDLINMEMIDKVGMNVSITRLGSISANLYYSPYDIYSWYQNFDYIFDYNLNIDDIDLAWAIGNVPMYNFYIPKDLYNLANDYKDVLKQKGLPSSDSTILSIIAANYCLIGKKGSNEINNKMRALRYDIERIAVALKMIDENYANWGINSLWESLPEKVKHNITNKFPN